MEQTIRYERRGHQKIDLPAATRLTEDRDASWIAAERCNVSLHPLQRLDEIELSVVAGSVVRRFGREPRVRKVAEWPETMRDRHDHGASLRQLRGVVAHHVAAQRIEPAAVKPDQNGQLFVRALRGREHVEIQA